MGNAFERGFWFQAKAGQLVAVELLMRPVLSCPVQSRLVQPQRGDVIVCSAGSCLLGANSRLSGGGGAGEKLISRRSAFIRIICPGADLSRRVLIFWIIIIAYQVWELGKGLRLGKIPPRLNFLSLNKNDWICTVHEREIIILQRAHGSIVDSAPSSSPGI